MHSSTVPCGAVKNPCANALLEGAVKSSLVPGTEVRVPTEPVRCVSRHLFQSSGATGASACSTGAGGT